MCLLGGWFLHPKIALARDFSPSDPPILHVGNFKLKTHADKRTNPSLCIKPEGADQTYYIDLSQDNGYDHGLRLMYNGVTYSAGRFELVYEITVFNSCQTIQLTPGYYCVDVLGGRGGNGGNGNSGAVSSDVKRECFDVATTTTASVLRGGDGNNGGVNSSGSVRSGGGGGASGVPSLFALGNTVLISQGGAGGTGGSGVDYNGNNRNCGGGGGGSATGGGNGLNGYLNYALNNTLFICGGGGGGATSGNGGTGDTYTAVLFFKYTAGDGSKAGTSGGGEGGKASRSTSSTNGGTGGNNVSYTCAGTTLWSYGGGGGGGVAAKSSSYVDLTGGNGGSGSKGSSSSSYVRVYRFE